MLFHSVVYFILRVISHITGLGVLYDPSGLCKYCTRSLVTEVQLTETQSLNDNYLSMSLRFYPWREAVAGIVFSNGPISNCMNYATYSFIKSIIAVFTTYSVPFNKFLVYISFIFSELSKYLVYPIFAYIPRYRGRILQQTCCFNSHAPLSTDISQLSFYMVLCSSDHFIVSYAELPSGCFNSSF